MPNEPDPIEEERCSFLVRPYNNFITAHSSLGERKTTPHSVQDRRNKCGVITATRPRFNLWPKSKLSCYFHKLAEKMGTGECVWRWKFWMSLCDLTNHAAFTTVWNRNHRYSWNVWWNTHIALFSVKLLQFKNKNKSCLTPIVFL